MTMLSNILRLSFLALVASTLATAKNIVITVGGNTSTDATTVFQPNQVSAQLGDTVTFNFTQGNHTTTQSTFAAPCLPAHLANITINGFDSSFRFTANGTAGTILSVPMLPQNVNQTMWFYDFNTCGDGGVGVINANSSSDETIDGFQRNAIRLNGTSSATSSTTSFSRTSSTSTPTSSPSNNSGAKKGVVITVPLLMVALAAMVI